MNQRGEERGEGREEERGTVVCQNTFARPNLYLAVRKKKGGGGGCFDDVLGCLEEVYRGEGKRGVLTGFFFFFFLFFLKRGLFC